MIANFFIFIFIIFIPIGYNFTFTNIDYIVVQMFTIDFILTSSVVYLIYKKYLNDLNILLNRTLCNLQRSFIFYIIILFIVISNINNGLSIMEASISKEDLVYGANHTYFSLLTSKIILLIASLLFFGRWYSFLLSVILICSISFFSMARSPIIMWLLLIFIYNILGLKFSKKKILFIIIFVIVAGISIGVLQGRTIGTEGLSYPIKYFFGTIIRYQAYILGMSEHLLTIKFNLSPLTPFFGFLNEKLLFLIGLDGDRVGIPGFNFITNFVDLGDGHSANVTYPWWIWFVKAFGPIGLIIKAVYIYVLFSIVSKLKFNYTKLYFVFIVMIMSFRVHPFLDTPAFYGLMGFILLDILKNAKTIVKKKFRKGKYAKYNNSNI